MPVRPHHTPARLPKQLPLLADDAWTTEFLPLLPAELEPQARSLKAFVRVRALASAADLLRALLAFALADHSSRSLGAWALLIGLADISEAAWRKRLRLASPWLSWLLSALLAVSPSRPLPSSRRVRLIDATYLPRLGSSGDAWRVHYDYDFTRGCLGSVTVAPSSSGEHLDHYPLLPGDILVCDGGYGYRRNLASALGAGADLLVRIHPYTFPLQRADGQAFDLLEWLRQVEPGLRELQLWCVWQGRRYQVRLLACPLPPEQAVRARKRRARRAKRKQRRSRPEAALLAGWLLLVSTLAEKEWPGEELMRLYRARWQVELVFKRFKQLLRVRALRCKGEEVAEATIRALLIAWVLQEDLGRELRRVLADEARRAVSSWQLARLSVASLRQAVEGRWTRARVVACLPRLRRFVCVSPRKREQQETVLRRWLNQHRGMAAVPSPS
jgi:hypothetical protein